MIQKILQELRRIELIKKPILRMNEIEKLENLFPILLKKEKQETIKKLEKEIK
tara:strand:+ start:169 stop:327 length:159 start_codon:yes stop_codon:yes gene_type:complete